MTLILLNDDGSEIARCDQAEGWRIYVNNSHFSNGEPKDRLPSFDTFNVLCARQKGGIEEGK